MRTSSCQNFVAREQSWAIASRHSRMSKTAERFAVRNVIQGDWGQESKKEMVSIFKVFLMGHWIFNRHWDVSCFI